MDEHEQFSWRWGGRMLLMAAKMPFFSLTALFIARSFGWNAVWGMHVVLPGAVALALVAWVVVRAVGKDRGRERASQQASRASASEPAAAFYSTNLGLDIVVGGYGGWAMWGLGVRSVPGATTWLTVVLVAVSGFVLWDGIGWLRLRRGGSVSTSPAPRDPCDEEPRGTDGSSRVMAVMLVLVAVSHWVFLAVLLFAGELRRPFMAGSVLLTCVTSSCSLLWGWLLVKRNPLGLRYAFAPPMLHGAGGIMLAVNFDGRGIGGVVIVAVIGLDFVMAAASAILRRVKCPPAERAGRMRWRWFAVWVVLGILYLGVRIQCGRI